MKCANILWLLKYLPFSTQREYRIKPDNLNRRSNNVVYLFSCKTCSKQYAGGTESSRSRFNNYKSAHRNFSKGNTVKEAPFHAHFEDDKHHGMSDWETTLVNQAESVDDLRRIESFWQCELDSFQPNGLNERDVVLFWCLHSFDVLLNFYIVFIFNGLTHYVYYITLISLIILRVLIILLFTLTVIIINLVITCVIIITITILFHLFISFKIYLFIYLYIYLMIRSPVWLEGSSFGRFFNPGMLRVEGVS